MGCLKVLSACFLPGEFGAFLCDSCSFSKISFRFSRCEARKSCDDRVASAGAMSSIDSRTLGRDSGDALMGMIIGTGNHRTPGPSNKKPTDTKAALVVITYHSLE